VIGEAGVGLLVAGAVLVVALGWAIVEAWRWRK
jgi:hypothetical protein